MNLLIGLLLCSAAARAFDAPPAHKVNAIAPGAFECQEVPGGLFSQYWGAAPLTDLLKSACDLDRPFSVTTAGTKFLFCCTGKSN